LLWLTTQSLTYYPWLSIPNSPSAKSLRCNNRIRFLPSSSDRNMPGKKRDIEEIYEAYPLNRRVPLSRAYPEVASLWDYKRNCGFAPEDFSSGSNVSAWFGCPKGPDHIFKTSIFTAVRSFRDGNNGCSFCANKKLSVTNSLVTVRPDLAKEFMEKRNKMKVKDVIAGGATPYWWQCQNNSKHTWRVSLNSRISRDTGCPKCGIGDTIDLRRYPKVLAQFDFKRNKDVDPYKLSIKNKVHWKCKVSKDHLWVSTFNRCKGERCPYCKGSLASSTNNLSRDKELAKQFHPSKNRPLKPQDISLTSHEKIWWKCAGGSDHEWLALVNMRVRVRTKCPFCLNRRLSITNCLATLFPKLAKELHPKKNGKLSSKEITATSTLKVWWICKSKHIFKQKVRKRTLEGQGCYHCYLANKSTRQHHK